MENLSIEQFTIDDLKKYKIPELKSFIKEKLYSPNKLKNKTELINFLIENKNVIFGLEKQKNILPKLEIERTTKYPTDEIVAAIDEAGYGACAGDLYIGVVILPKFHDDTRWAYLNDSKKLASNVRELLAEYVKEIAIDYVIHRVCPTEIDEMNVYQARMKGFGDALKKLKIKPTKIIVDGNAFPKFIDDEYLDNLQVEKIVKGDGIYKEISAASILAKTSRDNEMIELAKEFPIYKWEETKGYCTGNYLDIIREHGMTKYHRRSFLKNI